LGTSKTNPLLGWRAAFVLFGLIGVAWAIAFAIFFRDHPHEHRLVNEAERNLIEAGRETSEAPDTKLPVRAFVRSRNLWLLCIMYFCMVYAWTFNITYLPTYLTKRFDMSSQPVLSAIYQGGPLWAGAICSLIGGIFVDWLIRRTGDRRRTRQYVGMIADTLSALGMIAAIFAPNVHLFFIAISLSAMSNDMTLASAWAACQDIGQQFTAVTAACMNTVGTLGAALAGWLTGTIVQGTLASHAAALALPIKQLSQNDAHNAQMAGYNYSFITFAAAYFISAICWRFIDSTKPIVPAAPLEAST
jgi:predicted MFS family arabinose efflux permease